MPAKGKRTRKTRKDRVLQARIPEQLDDELRDRAEDLGLSVSTIVRNVLLHTFNLVEGVVSDSAQIARVIQGRPSSSPDDSSHIDEGAVIVGWQETVLNRNGVCEQCNVILAKGDSAAVGLPIRVRPVILCRKCLADLSSAQDSK